MTDRPRVIVTPRSAPGHPSLTRLAQAGYDVVFPAPGRVPSEDEQRNHLAGAVGYLAGVETISRDTLTSAPSLRVISRNGVGADAIDLAAAEELGIEVLRAPAANAQGVAELAVGLMLAAARHIPLAVTAIANGQWTREMGTELAGRTLGIIGCGNIGRRVARVAAAIGMQIIGYDAYPDPQYRQDGFRYASLDEVLETANVITLHAPPADRPLIDDVVLTRTKPDLILVNTARAALVDDNAVLAALNSGRLAGYAADVFDPEPPGETALTRHPRFIGTPHIGGFTRESVDRAMDAAVDQLIDRLDSGRG